MKKSLFIIQLAVFAGLWLLYLSLQNETIYRNTLGHFANNWENVNGSPQLVHKPYIAATNENLVQWDAEHYFKIRNNGYDQTNGDYIFAFFPLFPAIWKASTLSPTGIIFLNYLFFSVAIILLLKAFSSHELQVQHLLLSLCIPSIVNFFIPYTEALFLLTMSIGIYGYMRDNYKLYFAGMFFTSLTRPSYTFLMLSFLGAEILFLPEHRDFRLAIKKYLLSITPLITGTIVVCIVQLLYNSGSFFKFVEVQKYWDNKFRIPHNISDWAHEAFCMNIGVIFILAIPILCVLLLLFYYLITKTRMTIPFTYNNRRDYILIVSLLYILGNTLFVIFFRGGALRGIYRFTLCSPFFYVMLIAATTYLRAIPGAFRFILLSILALISIFFLGLVDYSTFWNFSDMGLFVLIGALSLWTFQEYGQNKFYQIALIMLLLFNLLWTTYLFNMYISNGWVFA